MLERLARTAFEEWNRGDRRVIPEIFDAPEVETHIVGAPIDADPVYYGPEGHFRAVEVRRYVRAHYQHLIEELRGTKLGVDELIAGAGRDLQGGRRCSERVRRAVRVTPSSSTI